MSIKLKLGAMAVLISVGIIVLIVAIGISTERLQVNGPLYQDIVRGKDLVADILPPPEYILEAYLVSYQALSEKDVSKIPSYQERFGKLRKEYDERHAYWAKELPEGKVKTLLLEQSYKPAVLFFDTASKDFFPALVAGNRAQAEKTMGDVLSSSYEAHRKVIDEIATITNSENTALEKRATSILQTSRMVTMTISAAFVVIVIAIFTLIFRNITGPLLKVIAIADTIAAGDLTIKVEVNSKDEFGQLMTAMKTMVENLRHLVSQTVTISASITAASDQLKSTSEQIATGDEEVAAQISTVATASEEMAATSNDIARNCHAAADSADMATKTTQNGFEIVKHTVDGIHFRGEKTRENAKILANLGKRSEQIGAIVGTIEDIADQTNLLALNAAIEAARAGEQGRGFAVVADEVRALAERTTRATKEISDMIKAIQQETNVAIHSMEEGVRGTEQGAAEASQLETSLQQILEQVNDVTTQVSQIATAAEQQTATTGEVTTNIQLVTEVVQQTAVGAEHTAVAAAQLAGQAHDLQALISKFRLQ
ncbi:methyl-accepting chemotaxis protein [Trichlorobacter thiogenes]|uniref:Methyl-accepting chemotaxis protein n=1 Tax=Trichlorobacter thiogenes TaxID=115783 RepID=A0A1T4L051_9BACT|nr:methyl-accepting chemotaxis protein [Trichlorobacter thiogenes]SJZ48066.1 methyl-accepting chemotaxis protein [Trichlorobacter thiogenes]